MTDDQMTLAKSLRADGLSYGKIAKAVGVSESAAWKLFNPRPPKLKLPPPPKTGVTRTPVLLPPHKFPSSVPMARHIDLTTWGRPSPTKSEMYRDLRTAVLNTSGRRA